MPQTTPRSTSRTSAGCRPAAWSVSASAPRWCATAFRRCLADACRAERMPLFEVPYRTPFIAVARARCGGDRGSVLRATQLGSRRAACDLAGGAAPGRAGGHACGARPSAGRVGRPVRRGGHSHARTSIVARARRRGRAAGRSRRRPAARRPRGILTPHRRRAVHPADPRPRRPPSGRDRDGGRRSRPGGPWRRDGGRRDGRARPRAETGPGSSTHAAAGRARPFPLAATIPPSLGESRASCGAGCPAAPFVVAMTDAGAARARRRRASGSSCAPTSAPAALFFGRGDDGLVLVVHAGQADVLDEFADRFGARIGVSDPAGYDAFSSAYRQARLARDRGVERVSHFADVARTGVLSVPPSDEARTVAAAALAPLVRHDARSRHGAARDGADVARERLLARGAAARALGVHRHTLRARIAPRTAARRRPLVLRRSRRDLGGAAPLVLIRPLETARACAARVPLATSSPLADTADAARRM